MRRPSPLLLALPLAFLMAACAEDQRNVFDPAGDRDPAQLVDFSVETTEAGIVIAHWAANEPVRAVVEWGESVSELHQHSYSGVRTYETGGSVRLLAPESSTEYAYVVRMRDRAGNESSQFLESEPTFTTAPVTTEALLLFVMIDVGWGDALYLESTDGRKVLIDAGHPADGRIVRDFLNQRGVSHLDVASMSHVHNDHVGGYFGDDFGGLPGLFNTQGVSVPQIGCDYFLDIADKTPGTIGGPYVDLYDAIRELPVMPLHLGFRTGANAANVSHPEALNWGEEVQVDLLAAGKKDFLYPNGAPPDLGSVQNNDSMVWRVQYRDFVLLLMGDGEFASEQFLQDRWSPEFLRTTVHKLGHHGSNDSNSERFLRITEPLVALITDSVLENPGVMHPFVLERVRNLGADYYASDRAIPNLDRSLPGVRGDIYIRTDGYAFTISADRIRYE